MGCIYSKGIDPDEHIRRHQPKSLNRLLSVSKKDEVVAAILDVAINGSRCNTPRYYSKRHDNSSAALPLSPEEREKKVAPLVDRKRSVGAHPRRATAAAGANADGLEGVGVSDKIEDSAGIVDVPNGFAREHAAAGWPSWLASVAGEAVKGWLPRKANSFEKLSKVEQLHKIFKLCGSPSDEYWNKSKLQNATVFKPRRQYKRCIADNFKDFSPSALALLEILLAIEPSKRGTAASALKSEFFLTKPFACDPSSLPKYSPSKEYDAKLADEAKRQRAEVAHGRISEYGKPRKVATKAMPVHEGNAEMQKRPVKANPKSISEKYDAQDDNGSGFPIEPSRGTSRIDSSHSGVLHPNAFGTSHWNMVDHEELRRIPSCMYSSTWVPNGPKLNTQRSYWAWPGAADFRDITSSLEARSTSYSKYNRLDLAEPSEKRGFDRPSSVHKKVDTIGSKDSVMGYGTRIRRIQYSGPLITHGGNIEDVLKEHERQIQQAVRKSRKDKVKNF